MNPTLQQKQKQKEQAKDLLLKGCYKMAMNKYIRLIDMGGDGFSPREWAVVHLNLAISLQFQNRLEEALDKTQQAIKIDKTYEKTYYRKIQILSELGYYEQALNPNVIPYFVKNKEIDDLIDKIKAQYQQSLGFSQLKAKLSSQQFTQTMNQEQLQKFLKETHAVIFRRIQQNKNEESLSKEIKEYYILLKEKGLGEESFLHEVHELVVKEPNTHVLDEFWFQYMERHEKLNEFERNLMGHLPVCRIQMKKFFKILNHIIIQYPIEEVCKFLQINKHYLKKAEQFQKCMSVQYFVENLDNIVDLCGEKLGQTLQKRKIKEFLKESLLMDILLSLYYEHEAGNLSTINNFTHCYKYKYKKLKQSCLVTEHEDRLFLQFVQNRLNQFRYVYLLDLTINYMKKDQLKNDLYTFLMELAQSKKEDRVFTMLYVVVALEINPVKNIFLSEEQKYPVAYYLQHSSDHKQFQELSLRFLLLVCLNDPSHLQSILKCKNQLKKTIKNILLESDFISEIQAINNSVRLLYLCVENIEEKQESIFAQKMGVSISEVHQARKLQGEVINEKLKDNINLSRMEVKAEISENWVQILVTLVQKLSKYEEKSLLKMMSKVFCILSEQSPSRFYHSPIIIFMLGCFKKNSTDTEENLVVSNFFRNITKKCNPQVYKYAHLQSIADCLLWGIKNATHQLQIFECLLSLISLSSQKIFIPLSDILSCLYEENEYITHGSLQLINNILINSQQQIDEKKFQQTISIVKKYYLYYKQLVQNENLLMEYPNLQDYAHPYKVYCTILSVLIVLQVQDSVPELSQWEEGKKMLMRLKGDIGMTVFKLAMHHQQRLPKNWQMGLQKEIDSLKAVDYEKWVKIQKLVK